MKTAYIQERSSGGFGFELLVDGQFASPPPISDKPQPNFFREFDACKDYLAKEYGVTHVFPIGSESALYTAVARQTDTGWSGANKEFQLEMTAQSLEQLLLDMRTEMNRLVWQRHRNGESVLLPEKEFVKAKDYYPLRITLRSNG